MNSKTHNIESSALTSNDFQDGELLQDLLDGIDCKISKLCGDSGYDSYKSYKIRSNLGGRFYNSS